MQEYSITKEADAFLCLLYDEYLNRRKNGIDRESAKRFDDNRTTRELFPEWLDSDISSVICELGQKKILKVFIGGDFCLTNESIIYMEHRFPNGASQVLDWFAKIKAAIPFL